METQGKQADSRAGDIILPYAAPSKHQGQNTHRYVVSILEQPQGKLTVAPPKHRSNFKTQVRPPIIATASVHAIKTIDSTVPFEIRRQDFARVHSLQFVGASFFFGDWQATPPAQRKRAYAYIHVSDDRHEGQAKVSSCPISTDPPLTPSHLIVVAAARGEADAHLRQGYLRIVSVH